MRIAIKLILRQKLLLESLILLEHLLVPQRVFACHEVVQSGAAINSITLLEESSLLKSVQEEIEARVFLLRVLNLRYLLHFSAVLVHATQDIGGVSVVLLIPAIVQAVFKGNSMMLRCLAGLVS